MLEREDRLQGIERRIKGAKRLLGLAERSGKSDWIIACEAEIAFLESKKFDYYRNFMNNRKNY